MHLLRRTVLLIGLCHVCACSQIPDEVESDFDFETQAFSFSNFGNEAHGAVMNTELAIRMFGRDAVCSPMSTADSCDVKPAAEAWLAEVNETLDYGHSEGLAVTAQLMSLGLVDPNEFGGRTASALDVSSAKLGSELAYWAATQKISKVHERDQSFAAKDVMPFLAQALKPGQTERWRLLIAMRDGDVIKGGHALVPFGYVKGLRDGLYLLRVYDSNMPQAEQRLEIDTVANTWRYEGSFDTALDRSYSGDAANQNLLSFSPVTARVGTLPAPWAEGAGLSLAVTRGALLVEGDGASVGLKDGVVVQQGGRVVPAAADCLCRLPNEIVNVQLNPDAGTAQTIRIASTGSSDTSSVSATGPGVSVKVDNINASATNPDTLSVDATGKKVTYAAGGDAVSMTTTTAQPNGKTTKVSVTVGGSSKTVTVDSSDPSNVTVSLDNLPAGTKVSVTVTTTNADGTKTQTTASATTTGNDAKVSINPDTGSSMVDTSINFEPCINAQKDMNEADVDCGAACAAMTADVRRGDGLCVVGKHCGSDADCQNRNCVQSTCSEPSCTDGRRNGSEPDVDCGGACATRCALGRSCSTGYDCVTGATCVQSTCVSRLNHTLRITGVPSGRVVALDTAIDLAEGFTRFFTGTGGDLLFSFGATANFALKKSVVPGDMACDWVDTSRAGPCRPGMNDPCWEWVWVRDPSSDAGNDVQTNTLACRLTQAPLRVTTGNTGCPSRVDGFTVVGALPELDFTVWGDPRSDQLDATSGQTIAYINERRDAGPAYVVTGITGPTVLSLKDGGYFGATVGQVSQACRLVDAGSGFFDPRGMLISVTCTCDRLSFDGGMASADAGLDAGVDAGFDAGVDAGPVLLALGGVCANDSDCQSADCWCASSPGACGAGMGRCGAGKGLIAAPTADNVTSSGTFTVPAGCTTVHVSAWGAAGGGGRSAPFPVPMTVSGGAGGAVSGSLSSASGDVFTCWVGQGGAYTPDAVPNQSAGSYVGTAAPGGLGDGNGTNGASGGGGGLSSCQQTGSAARQFSVPGGSGASSAVPGVAAGGSGAGSASTRAGANAAAGSLAGGGGAGENGGNAGSTNLNGAPGAFGVLPSGLTSATGSSGNPVQSPASDYALCPANAATAPFTGGTGGNGCFVLRCVYP
jgi:hypothetical protein